MQAVSGLRRTGRPRPQELSDRRYRSRVSGAWIKTMRRAFRMSVHANSHDEYARRHQPIWAELQEVLLAHGVKTYSIYLDPITSDLFAYAEIDSEERWKAIADTAVCRRWWQHMRELMPSNPDDSPVSRDLVEVFHVEGRDEGAS